MRIPIPNENPKVIIKKKINIWWHLILRMRTIAFAQTICAINEWIPHWLNKIIAKSGVDHINLEYCASVQMSVFKWNFVSLASEWTISLLYIMFWNNSPFCARFFPHHIPFACFEYNILPSAKDILYFLSIPLALNASLLSLALVGWCLFVTSHHFAMWGT